MQWLLLSVKIQKMISVWWFANKVTYHIDAERNPTGSIVGRTSNNEERSYYKMEVSNNYSTAKLWGTSDKKVSKSSEKNKWKLTDSLKEKIVELAKKDAQDNVYMGNAFMNLRKMEVSKVAPNRAALIGKFNQSMNSGNMSAMKEVEKADKKWLCILFGIPYEAEFQGEGTGSAAHVYNECGEEVLTYTEGVTLLDFLEQAEGKNQNLADKQIALAGGGTLNFTILTSGGYGVQIQSQGVNVLLNTGAGWGYEMTPAELTKKDEFYSIYWKEYNAVKNGMNSELKELPDYLEKRSVFEAKA